MSSSTKAGAFSFDTEFSEDGTVLNEGGQLYKRFTQAELKEACDAARAEAMASVEAETRRRIAGCAEMIARNIAPALPFAVALAESLRGQSAELALRLSRKIAGEALQGFASESVKACLQDAVSGLPRKAVVTLKVNPELVPELEPLLASLTPQGGEIILKPDANATPGAWSLEWENGQLAHDPEQITEQLEELVRAHLSQPINPQGDLFADVA